MTRARANVRSKFYLAVFALGVLLSGSVVGLQLSKNLTATADGICAQDVNLQRTFPSYVKLVVMEFENNKNNTTYLTNQFTTDTENIKQNIGAYWDNMAAGWNSYATLCTPAQTQELQAIHDNMLVVLQRAIRAVDAIPRGTQYQSTKDELRIFLAKKREEFKQFPTIPQGTAGTSAEGTGSTTSAGGGAGDNSAGGAGAQPTTTYTITPNEAGKTSYKCVPSSHPTESATFKVSGTTVFWEGRSNDYEISKLPGTSGTDAISAEKKAWIIACAGKVKAVAAGTSSGPEAETGADPETGGSGDDKTPPAAPAPEVTKTEINVQPLKAIVLDNYFNASSIEDVILKTIPNILLSLVGLVAMGYFLVNALRYIFSAGNSDATAEAKTGMIYAAIGIAVVVLSYGIIRTLAELLGGS